MDISRVVFYENSRSQKAIAACSVILDDELRLNDILLFKGEKGYFLVLPSRQDVYQEVGRLNNGVEITYPKNPFTDINKKKKYEEFYHPLKGDFYKKLLAAIVEEYEKKNSVE